MTKYIFVTGGVVSSLGKGITTAAMAVMLEKRGLKVSIQTILTPVVTVLLYLLIFCLDGM